MSDLAFLFPGQGSQFAGMGKSLAAEFVVARETFSEADDALGFSLSQLCFDGPDEELKKTANTQPAILAIVFTPKPVCPPPARCAPGGAARCMACASFPTSRAAYFAATKTA